MLQMQCLLNFAVNDEIIQNTMDDLFSLREINKDIEQRFEAAADRAGMTLDDLKKASNIVDGDLQLVGNISANTPEAITVKYANSRTPRWRGDQRGTPVRNETRFHTKFEGNPVTGQMDVVPSSPWRRRRIVDAVWTSRGRDIDASCNGRSDEF